MKARDLFPLGPWVFGAGLLGCLLLAVAGCAKLPGYRLKYTYHTPPGTAKLEEFSDFRFEMRKKGDREYTVLLPRKIAQQGDGSVRAEYMIVINPEPAPGQKYEVRSSYRLDGKLVDGEKREEVFILGSAGQ